MLNFKSGASSCRVRVFREERDRPVIIWLDLRRPMHFATRGVFKAARAAQTAALIAWSAVANGDRLGGLVFSEREHVELRPRLGRRAALRLLQAITQNSLWEGPAAAEREEYGDAEHTLARLIRVARPGSMIFLLSDFRNLGEQFGQRGAGRRRLARDGIERVPGHYGTPTRDNSMSTI